VTIERLRSQLGARDATIVSALAYAGLRPGELRNLQRGHIAEHTIVVNAAKTGHRRAVRLLSPLREDLDAWIEVSAFDSNDYLFRGSDGGLWTANAFEKWRSRVFAPALARIGLYTGRPYDLRHSFASLLLHEGRSVIYVARQLGHGAELTMRTYGHVIDELDDRPQLPAEEAIHEARAERRP
jgi:integrase